MKSSFKKFAVACSLIISPVALAADTIKFAATEVAGLEALHTNFGPFKAKLEELTGKSVEFYPVSSRNSAVEALNSELLDFALVGPAEYVIFRQRAKATPVVGWQRMNYFGKIFTTADSELNSLTDFKGKTIAFGDVGSTSQHLAPAQLLSDHGLKQGVDYRALNLHRNVSVEAMLRGDVDAVAISSAYLDGIRKLFPNEGFKVIGRGPDLPNDQIVAGKHVSQSDIELVRRAFADNQEEMLNAIMSAEMNKKYTGGRFLTDVDDSDYDYIRRMYQSVGLMSFDKFLGE
ncbi:PhnD/SsuA/transferrin family substrate-binding protein [Photobacterium makurazakiensis]|uniref:PhnD/SsuA/transferrin family substrate-binding protein n=1 Tax=Photobacterium TaxID=657 RepID=UPI003D0F7578